MLPRQFWIFVAIVATQGVLRCGVLCLRLRELLVPAVVIRGEAVWLNCSYDLENEKLYSIKWHKDDVEFYRYLPEDIPPGQTYHVDGVHLDLNRCDRGNVFMPYTDVKSEGSYRCEVSTEAPIFKTVKDEREMRIYVNPSSRPKILGRKPNYSPGETVNVTCISAPSRPAAFLKWWINGQEASPDQLIHPQTVEDSPDDEGLFTSRLTLRFSARPYHFFLGGRLRVQCEAIISQAHTLRSEEVIITSSGTTTATGAYDHLKEGPRIEGDKHTYDVGDLVDLNCTAAKSQPPAELHWYINDKEVRSEYLVPRSPISHPDGKQSTVLGLKFEVKARHFITTPKQQREMKLRCTATLSEVKRMTSEPLDALMSPPHMRHKSDLHVDEDNTGIAVSSTNILTMTSAWSFVVFSLSLRRHLQ